MNNEKTVSVRIAELKTIHDWLEDEANTIDDGAEKWNRLSECKRLIRGMLSATGRRSNRLTAMTAPTQEAAHAMGAKGGEYDEAERLAFEAWMRGHCWSMGGIQWNGSEYSAPRGVVDGWEIGIRMLWAAWRDRAALGACRVENHEYSSTLLGGLSPELENVKLELLLSKYIPILVGASMTAGSFKASIEVVRLDEARGILRSLFEELRESLKKD